MRLLQSKKTIKLAACLYTLVFTCALLAQGRSSQVRRQIVVGDLIGRTDIRELKLLTARGLLPVTSGGNGKPFTTARRSQNRLVVRLHSSPTITADNPNAVVFKFFETERALITALILEQVDAAVLENEESAREVSRSNDHFLPYPLQMQRNDVKMIIYNNRHEPFADADVRRALSYGIDHGYIIKKLIGGKASIAKGPFDDSSDLYTSGLNSYKYNPRVALETLQAAGWRDTNKDGILEKSGRRLVINLFYQKGLRTDEAISRIVKINLIKLGIDVRPRPLPKKVLNDRLATGDFEAVLTDHVFEEDMTSLIEFFGKGGSQNYSGYHSSTVENYFRFYNNATDSKRRKTLVQGVQAIINQSQPVTVLYFKWLTHHLVNVSKFSNFRHTQGPKRGKIRPYEEWVFKRLP